MSGLFGSEYHFLCMCTHTWTCVQVHVNRDHQCGRLTDQEVPGVLLPPHPWRCLGCRRVLLHLAFRMSAVDPNSSSQVCVASTLLKYYFRPVTLLTQKQHLIPESGAESLGHVTEGNISSDEAYW